jgi:hypothetical protein
VLHEHGRISEDTVRASMALEGASAEQFDSIWIKLIGHAERPRG